MSYQEPWKAIGCDILDAQGKKIGVAASPEIALRVAICTNAHRHDTNEVLIAETLDMEADVPPGEIPEPYKMIGTFTPADVLVAVNILENVERHGGSLPSQLLWRLRDFLSTVCGRALTLRS